LWYVATGFVAFLDPTQENLLPLHQCLGGGLTPRGKVFLAEEISFLWTKVVHQSLKVAMSIVSTMVNLLASCRKF
jgi:hypothetical protein